MIRKLAVTALKRSFDPQRVHRLRLALGRANTACGLSLARNRQTAGSTPPSCVRASAARFES